MGNLIDLAAERAKRLPEVKTEAELDAEWEAIPIPEGHRRVTREYSERLNRQCQRRDVAFALGQPFDEPWEEE